MTAMTMNFMNQTMGRGASANCAEASSCAQFTSNNIALILGAMMMASIIICALILVSGISLLVLALLALVLLVLVKVYPPRKRMRA